ncbi:AsmA family protein [Corallincola luteus]|uniref:AsmA family protein n=1 Tax=Corallincola luteus TaxID=1775177 RepID=A0ABY2AM85_9GAMM|nr:AsmA-like C-terminal region-containing protein [Corallincola luteus]TCI04065.1 AsmA family protein [Corallincola luteus]
MNIRRLVKWTAATLIAVPILAIVAFLLWFKGDYYRGHLERLVTDNTPIALTINAPVEYSLTDPYLITLRALEFSFNSKPILTLDRFALRIDELSLLKRAVVIEGISVDRPALDMSPEQLEDLLAAFAEGKEAEPQGQSKEELLLPLSSLSLKQLNIDGLSLRWEDLKQPIRLKELTLAITNWQVIQEAKLLPTNWQLAVYLFAEEVTWQHVSAEDLTLHALMDEHRFRITDASVQIFSGQATLASSTVLDAGFATTIHSATVEQITLDDALFGPLLSLEQDTSNAEPMPERQDKDLLTTISLPISTFNIENLEISELGLNSEILGQGLALNNFSLNARDMVLVNDYKFDPAVISGTVEATFDRLISQQHQLDNLMAELGLSNGTLLLNKLEAELLNGSLSLVAKTQLADHLQTEITLLQLKDLQISDTLWAQTTPPADETDEPTATVDDEPTAMPLKGLYIKQVEVERLQLNLTQMEPQVAADSLNMSLSNLALIEDFTLATYPDLLALPFALTLTGANISSADREIDATTIAVKGGQPFEISKFNIESKQGTVAGHGTIETQDSTLPFELTLAGKQLDLTLLDPLDTGYPLSGKAQLDASLTGSAVSSDALLNSLTGPVHLSTGRATMYNIDVDMTLQGFLDSQELTLTDVGAFALLGPIGLAVSKASAVSSAAAGALAGGETQIAETDININFNSGVIDFGPSAIATEKHRVALFGDIDLPKQRFDLLRTTVLDDEACVRLARSIDGPFSNPDVQVASAITGTVTGLFSGAFSGTEKYFGDGCEPVYSGPVKSPKPFDFEANAEKLVQQENDLLKTLPAAAQRAEEEMKKAMFEIIQQAKEQSTDTSG